MESAQPPSTGSQTPRVPAQRSRPGQVGPAPESSDAAVTPSVSPSLESEKQGSRLRMGLAVVGGVLALLCLGGAGIAYVLYDNATKPDRSAPDVVVDNYLRALLVDRNDHVAEEYVCSDRGDLRAIEDLRADLERREGKFGVEFTVMWGKITVDSSGSSADASTELTLSTTLDNVRQTDKQTWIFRLTQNSEWAICSSRRIS